MTRRPTETARTEKEQKMSLLSIELSQERIRDAEREVARRRGIAQARAARRARRDAELTAARVRRLLTAR
ncbi:hypothetical protein [Actinoallomurus iriomotensis]|jgi:hypothetical protein|uniref:Uncharacterized protein n=1 Tax=Actinoallomurus iriomotensis TaxID=478107 RepID=A0A9W6RXM9_9ACTN|nr:hypothetical protein [Actinoallomurus iriomotensis]GLY73126.1 hypothetical protein Airi01_013930 [Actinoallomurus iriomotensis]GLY84626.1 hypothetical protein Airi02_025550 [Actinoallomurus iriomotensis]